MNVLKSMLTKHSVYKKLAAVATTMILAFGIIYYAWQPVEKITSFDYVRDAQEIHALFNRDWYWLVAASPEDYDVDFVLRYRALQYNIESAGILTIKVLREEDKFKGFVAYYRKNTQTGVILFLSVKSDERKRGYGQQLATYAINDLWAQGCTKIKLVTRPSNDRAVRLYKRLGFKETSSDGGFVDLELVK